MSPLRTTTDRSNGHVANPSDGAMAKLAWRDLSCLLAPVRPLGRLVACALAPAIAVNALNLVGPLLIKGLIDAITAHRSMATLLSFGGAFGLAQVVLAVLDRVQRERIAYAAERVGMRARQNLYEKVQGLSPITLGGLSRGDALFRLTADVTAIQALVTDGLIRGTSVGIAMLGALIGLFLLDVRLACLAVLAVPIFILATRTGRARIRQTADEAQSARSRITSALEKRLGALEALQLARRERFDSLEIFRTGRAAFTANLEFVRAQARLWSSLEMITGVALSLVLTVGAIAVVGAALPLGSLLAAYLYVGHLFSAITAGSIVLGTLEKGLAGLRRAARTLRLEPEVQSGPLRVRTSRRPASLTIDNVSFAYGERQPALDGVRFAVAPGEHVALVGTSGSGKSTVVRLLARFFDPHHGCVLLDGVDIRRLELRALRRTVAIMPQEPVLLPGSLEQNIVFGRRDCRITPEEAAAVACFDDGLARELTTREVGGGGARLSRSSLFQMGSSVRFSFPAMR